MRLKFKQCRLQSQGRCRLFLVLQLCQKRFILMCKQKIKEKKTRWNLELMIFFLSFSHIPTGEHVFILCQYVLFLKVFLNRFCHAMNWNLIRRRRIRRETKKKMRNISISFVIRFKYANMLSSDVKIWQIDYILVWIHSYSVGFISFGFVLMLCVVNRLFL